MDILDKNSIILRIGDLKLDDTEYTFGKHRTVGQFKYIPIENQISSVLAACEHRIGTKIRKNDQQLFFVYGANRPSSNSQSIALGYFARKKYHFIREDFVDIYSDNPELLARHIITTPCLYYRPNANIHAKLLIYNRENKKIINQPSSKDMGSFSRWQQYISMFEEAFSEENLTELSLVRQRRLEKRRNQN